MLHVPIDVDIETALEADVKSWFAFAAQKTDELIVLALALAEGRDEVAAGHSLAGDPRSGRDFQPHYACAPSIVGWPTVGVNPDCGLKTRRWEEVRPALNLVAAVRAIR